MKKNILIVGLLLAVIGYIAVGPYITISAIKDGIVEKDPEKLSDNIDFPALRQNMKDQLSANIAQNTVAKLKDNPLEALASVFASTLIDGIVDSYFTPHGLAKIVEGKKVDVQKSNDSENTTTINPIVINVFGSDNLIFTPVQKVSLKISSFVDSNLFSKSCCFNLSSGVINPPSFKSLYIF